MIIIFNIIYLIVNILKEKKKVRTYKFNIFIKYKKEFMEEKKEKENKERE